jgi:hypothetical protein
MAISEVENTADLGCVDCHMPAVERPFIIDLWDTRLPRWQPRSFSIEMPATGKTEVAVLEAVVWYYLVGENRRKRIGYENREPTAYQVFKQRVVLKGQG